MINTMGSTQQIGFSGAAIALQRKMHALAAYQADPELHSGPWAYIDATYPT